MKYRIKGASPDDVVEVSLVQTQLGIELHVGQRTVLWLDGSGRIQLNDGLQGFPGIQADSNGFPEVVR